MIYADYARRKMHNVVKLGTAEGYPLVINNAEGKKLKDYTIEGNTEYGENLFNYTEPSTNSKKADVDGWFDVTIDNTTGTSPKTVWCATKPNYRLKTNTQYQIFVEVAEKSGNVNNVVATQWGSFVSQLFVQAGGTIIANSIGTKTDTIQTKDSFENVETMLRGNVSVPAGKSGHIKFRVAVYETEKDVFLPYTKTSVGDMTENLFNYTEPLNSSQVKADADGFFDVAIDNSTGTSNKYDFCYVKLNNKLKPSTSYAIFCEVKEYTGNIRVNIVNNYTSDKGQFIYNNVASNLGIFTFQNETRASFDDCSNSLRTYCYCSAGNSGHAKFRIAIYEIEKDYFEPYNKYKIPIVVSGKNLIPYPYEDTTKTLNGVTFTDNGDGSITVNGTPTEYSYFMFGVIPIMPSTTFTISKNQSADAANVAFAVRELDENRVPIGTEISIPPTVVTHTFTVTDNTRYIRITLKRWGSNIECKGTFKPMLELGTLKEPQTTIYLNAPLADGESINYKADNLPDIVLNKGSNTITTDTAVKPKKISAKYYKK